VSGSLAVFDVVSCQTGIQTVKAFNPERLYEEVAGLHRFDEAVSLATRNDVGLGADPD